MRVSGFRSRALRLFAPLLALAILLSPSAASALALGKIRVTGSTTNMFKAEIPVQSDGKGGVVVTLGSESDYRKLGLKRPAFLDNLQVQVADHPSNPGQKIIYITSPEPIYQPSFNLVVKAFMSGGQIMENYFLALDFQKNLSLEASSTKDEDKSDLKRAAKELESPKSSEATGSSAELDKIRLEEMEASRREDRIRSALDGNQAAPAQKEAIPEPKPEVVKEAKVEEKPASLDDIKSSERHAPDTSMEEKPAPAKTAAVDSSKEPVEIIIKGNESEIRRPGAGVKKEKMDAPAKTETKSESKAKVAVEAAGSYTVSEGDTLYKVAIKTTSRADMEKFAVAVWKLNKGLFIKGNIHGLRKNAKMDFDGVEEEMDSISRAEARKIISEQWAQWQNFAFVKTTVAARPAPEKAPAKEEKQAPAKQVAAQVPAAAPKAPEKPAQPAPEVKQSAAALSPFGIALKSLTEWKKSKGLDKSDSIDIIDVKPIDGGKMEARVVKRTAKGRANLTLTLKNENGAWKVEKEEEASQPKPAGGAASTTRPKPYTVHVATFKDAESARGMVQYFREKNHNAYDMTSYQSGPGGLYRVLVGRFSTYAEAIDFSKLLVEARLVRASKVLKLPYAASAGDFQTEADADKKAKELAVKGISAYTVKGANGDVALVVGAFDSETAAKEASAKLSSAGAALSVVRP